MMTQYPLVVTGASGHLGRKVVEYLLNTLHVAPENIIALSRKPENLADFAAVGVQVRAADFDDTGSLAQAFAGGKRLLLISTDTLDMPGKRLQQHLNAVAVAGQSDIQHIVYTSMPKPETSVLLFAGDHLNTEKAVQASGKSWTILRNNWYFENLFLSLGHMLESGHWYSAAGDGKVAHIARNDLAYAAAVALAANDVTSKTYTLTGTEAFTETEIAKLVSDVAGKAITVVSLTDEQKIAGLKQAGLPDHLAAVLASFDSNTRSGGVADITDDFYQLTGRRPQRYRDWLASQQLHIQQS
ncbi:SDR family oxidoreductase [Chromatiaceae bacterium AAb-1]|nr:SDR family oxidoreductase [Chromatiaceae bacterium AAb-1]